MNGNSSRKGEQEHGSSFMHGEDKNAANFFTKRGLGEVSFCILPRYRIRTHDESLQMKAVWRFFIGLKYLASKRWTINVENLKMLAKTAHSATNIFYYTIIAYR